jgi:pyrroline-5-carboxylate reductase
VIGVIGSGNLARALVRGWGEPVLLTDSGSGSAAALAAEVGGERVATNAELAERADLVVLCHKPYQLDLVAGEIAGRAPRVVSTLARTPLAALRAALPGAEVVRVTPNTATELRAGVSVLATEPDDPSALEEQAAELFGRLGAVVAVPERLSDVANALSGVGPAYVALLAEAWADSGVRHGLTPAQASDLVAGTLAGSAALLRAADGDTLRVRRAVTSPGGVTARGLAALERAGVRSAFDGATDAVLGASR